MEWNLPGGVGYNGNFSYDHQDCRQEQRQSILAASAYLNGDIIKDYETGRTSYYTSKDEVVYTRLMMCENAPPIWTVVPEENIVRFQKSLRYNDFDIATIIYANMMYLASPDITTVQMSA